MQIKHLRSQRLCEIKNYNQLCTDSDVILAKTPRTQRKNKHNLIYGNTKHIKPLRALRLGERKTLNRYLDRPAIRNVGYVVCAVRTDLFTSIYRY